VNKIWLLSSLILTGCASAPRRETRPHCVVDAVSQKSMTYGSNEWRAFCRDGRTIIFDRKVRQGDLVYFIPFVIDGDKYSHGYVKEVTRPKYGVRY
jgi:hypothetical protein